MVLLEAYPCGSKDELHARERYWIEKEKCVNINIPVRRPEEYKERRVEICAKYRQANKERITERFQCECGVEFTRQHKQRHLKTNRHLKWEESQLNA
jgi:broad specificity polyphosphatase/5'/3'-nucleotidase SurE